MSAAAQALRARLAERAALGGALLLDGATGTELERRGVRSTLPLWSAHALLEAPEAVEVVHRAYLEAGAELLTANTFRTQERALSAAGRGGQAGELTARAVALARRAAEGAERRAFVLGSAAPLEDCYHPERVPGADALAREHAAHARHLVRAGVDAILVETMNTRREADAASRAAREAGAEVLIGFVCDAQARLLSGEPLAEALDAARAWRPLALGVNCLTPHALEACLPALARTGLPGLAYANLGAPYAPGEVPEVDASPEAYARHARRWVRAGVRIVGGCCGTTPAHVAAIAAALALPHACSAPA